VASLDPDALKGAACQKPENNQHHPPHTAGIQPTKPSKLIEAWDLGFNLGNALKSSAVLARSRYQDVETEQSLWYIARELLLRSKRS